MCVCVCVCVCGRSIYIYIYIYISRSVKRLNKVTKSIYKFIMDLTTNAFQSVYVVSSSGSK